MHTTHMHTHTTHIRIHMHHTYIYTHGTHTHTCNTLTYTTCIHICTQHIRMHIMQIHVHTPNTCIFTHTHHAYHTRACTTHTYNIHNTRPRHTHTHTRPCVCTYTLTHTALMRSTEPASVGKLRRDPTGQDGSPSGQGVKVMSQAGFKNGKRAGGWRVWPVLLAPPPAQHQVGRQGGSGEAGSVYSSGSQTSCSWDPFLLLTSFKDPKELCLCRFHPSMSTVLQLK